jgi:hypothetical protein
MIKENDNHELEGIGEAVDLPQAKHIEEFQPGMPVDQDVLPESSSAVPMPESTSAVSIPEAAPLEEKKPALEGQEIESPAPLYSKEMIRDTIEVKFDILVEESIQTSRKAALHTFMAKINAKNISIQDLNQQFIWFRKLDQLALNILQINYTGNTPQRYEALGKLKLAIMGTYQMYASANEDHAEKNAYQSLQCIEQAIRNSIKQDNNHSWWNSTVGYFKPSESKVATALENAALGAEAIKGIEDPTPMKRM